MKKIDEIVNAIKSEKTLDKHVLRHTWMSGCSTMVYPITLWANDVSVQLDTRKNVFDKCISRIMKKNPDLFKDGYFKKNDGSCPAEVVFIYTKETAEALKNEG